MSFINFEGTNFTLITDENEDPWMIAKELCDYLERCRDTLIRQVGSITEKWYFSYDGQSEYFFWIS